MELERPKKRKVSAEALMRHLQEQVSHLIHLAQQYDDGMVSCAKLLSVPVRVLLHDTRHSFSLLKQLGIKENLSFYNTAPSPQGSNIAGYFGLTGLVLNPDGRNGFAPRLDNLQKVQEPHMILFRDWWDQAVIIDELGSRFSRKDITLHIANQDGGAHVDPLLSTDYDMLSSGESIGWKKIVNGNVEHLKFGELATMRQIAHEVLVSLARGCPAAFDAKQHLEAYLEKRSAADEYAKAGVILFNIVIKRKEALR